MINKKILIKIFIVFFIVNIFYFIICKSYAASVTPSVSSLTLNLGETKNIQVIVDPKSLGTNLYYTTILEHLAEGIGNRKCRHKYL